MVKGLLSENPFDDPDYEYTGPLSLAPFRQRKLLDIDETSDDGVEFAFPGLLRGPLNAAARMGQMALGERPLGFILGDVMDFSPAGLLNRIPKNALGMNVFHGTPNLFKPEPGFPQGRPRLDKMGTGEGAQAYGRGFYSAESRGVGSDYRDMLAPPPGVRVSGKPITAFKFANALSDKVASKYPEMPVEEVKRHSGNAARIIFNRAQELKELNDYDNVFMRAFLDRQSKNDDDLSKIFRVARDEMPAATWSEETGILYKLDIPDADAAKFLDYDAPLSVQPKVVQDAITKLGFMPDTPDKLAGGDVWFRMRQQLGEQGAADAMREAGVPGLRYKDAGSRGKGDSDGTRNFVVWDQDVLDRTKVLQRNDEMFDKLLSPDRQTKVETSRRGNVLEINKIETPPEKRGQGFADEKLRELIEQADAEGLTLALTPSNAFGANKKRLENWYKRNGFVRNAGRNKDFTTKEAFVRPPKTTNLKAAPGVPAMGLLSSDNDNRPGGINLLGLYTGGVI